jgi:tRNA U34 5-methylaminomethyl-2-thiouridine-forming methyltransferase MnmC
MEQRRPQLILCEDGSHTIFLPELNETYHSTRGAIPESIHVYLENGYNQLLKEGVLNVLEIGYGTGLNALLTAKQATDKKQQTKYHSLEPYPLEEEVWTKLNYGKILLEEELWQQLNAASWNETHQITKVFQLHKDRIRLEEVILQTAHYDVVYFDGFAPRKQAEIWDIDNLDKLYQAMKSGARLVTYTASAQLKRNLKQLGFDVQLVKGPPGKKEMILAIKKA